MKRLLASALAGLMLVMPCCMLNQQNMDAMDDQRFQQVLGDTESAVTIGAIVLKKQLKEDARAVLLTVAAQAKEAIKGGAVSLPESVDALLAQFSAQLAKAGMKDDDILLVRACVRLANSSLGGVQLGVAGIGSERTKAVVLSVLAGVEAGLK